MMTVGIALMEIWQNDPGQLELPILKSWEYSDGEIVFSGSLVS